MSLPHGDLKGGPLCGMKLARASRHAFVWVDDGGRAFAKPSPKRHLYRSLGVNCVTKHEDFLYAADTHRFCTDCGGYNEVGEGERDPHCMGCGAALAPN